MIVNVRKLNVITISNVYSLSFQSNIIAAMRQCPWISIIDCANFFYQWRVHFDDKHKLTIVSHRDQKSFNVAIMSFRNSLSYVQRQIDKILRSFRNFAKIYINDVMIFSKTKKKHLKHLRQIFEIFKHNNISINSFKSFLSYSSIRLLKQKVDFF